MPVEGRLPDFLIIGAMRSGTTTLWNYLRHHPDIFFTDAKEIGFFSDPKYNTLSESWYRSLFANAKTDQLCGEASTAYSRWPHHGDTAARIYKFIPNVRLIYILRDPVERAFSHYVHRVKKKKTSLSFEEEIAKYPYYINTSLYIKQLDHLLEFFSKEQIHCLLLEDLISHPHETLAEIQNFLQIPTKSLPELAGSQFNAAGDLIFRKKLHKRLYTMPGASKLKTLLPTSWKNQLFKVLSKYHKQTHPSNHESPTIKDETRTYLRGVFAEPNQRLASFLGRDLSHWSEGHLKK